MRNNRAPEEGTPAPGMTPLATTEEDGESQPATNETNRKVVSRKEKIEAGSGVPNPIFS